MKRQERLQKAWGQNDELFKQLLYMGWEWEKVVAERLRTYGVDAQAKTTPRFRDSIKNAGNWACEPDVLVRVVGLKRSLEIEVKSQAHSFSDLPHTWPENRGPVLIETVKSMEGRDCLPEAYAFVSRRTRGILAVDSKAMEAWYVHKTYDKVRDIQEEWWVCESNMLQPFEWLVHTLGGTHG